MSHIYSFSFVFILATGTVNPQNGWCNSCNKHHVSNHSGKYSHPDVCPKAHPHIILVVLIETAGAGVGSCIKGSSRRGGNKLRKEHMQNCVVE